MGAPLSTMQLLRRRLDKLAGNQDFLADLLVMHRSYSKLHLRNLDRLRQKAEAIQDEMADRLYMSNFGGVRCDGKQLIIVPPKVVVRFDSDVAILCGKWGLHWSGDLMQLQGTRWFRDILLRWKRGSQFPDLKEIERPPDSLVSPLVVSCISSLDGTLGRMGPKTVRLLARSGVTARDMRTAAKNAYAQSQYRHSWIKNDPYELNLGRPSIGDATRTLIRDEFTKRRRSDFRTQKAFLENVMQSLRRRLDPFPSLKTFQSEYRKFLTETTPPTKTRQYLTAGKDTRS